MSSPGLEAITQEQKKASSAGSGTTRKDAATELLSRIWQQHLPLMRERVACLRQAGRDAQKGEFTPEQRTEASDLAHKLAGSLGMFGYPRGSEIAREIEQMLEDTHALDGERLFRLTEDLYDSLPLGG